MQNSVCLFYPVCSFSFSLLVYSHLLEKIHGFLLEIPQFELDMLNTKQEPHTWETRLTTTEASLIGKNHRVWILCLSGLIAASVSAVSGSLRNPNEEPTMSHPVGHIVAYLPICRQPAIRHCTAYSRVFLMWQFFFYLCCCEITLLFKKHVHSRRRLQSSDRVYALRQCCL